jgi:hypothetical protein
MEARCVLCEVRSVGYADIIIVLFYSENIVGGEELE